MSDEPFDLENLDSAADTAYSTSDSYQSLADDAWVAGDTSTYETANEISNDMSSYGDDMTALSQDPTDSSSWSDAYQSADDASWAAWRESVDAYVAGDNESAYEWNQVSLDQTSLANDTWNAWGDATSGDSGAGSDYSSGADYSSGSDYSSGTDTSGSDYSSDG